MEKANMKKAVYLIVLSLTGSALALGPMGPPTTTMRQGQWEIGAAYTDSEQEINLENGAEFEDAELRSVLARVTVGLATNRMELFGLGGWAEFEDEGSDNNIVVGIGTRITATSEAELNWGVMAQILRYEFDIGDTELNLYEIQVGIGPCWRPGNFILYGGPMLQFVTGQSDSDLGGDVDIEEDTLFGGYIGVGAKLWEHLTANVEGQVTTESRAISAGLAWQF